MNYYIREENEVLVIEVTDWSVNLSNLKFTSVVFENAFISELQDLLWKWHVLAQDIQDTSQDDLSRLRDYINTQLYSFDFYIAGYAIRRLCLDNDLQSGEVGRLMLRDYILSLERECNSNTQNLCSEITDGAALQLLLLGMSFPIRVLKVRNYLLHIARLIDIVLGHVQSYDLPLMSRNVT